MSPSSADTQRKCRMPKQQQQADATSWEIEVSEKTGRPVRWNGQNWPYYRRLMELAFRRKGSNIFDIATGVKMYDNNWTDLQKASWEDAQLEIQELLFASVGTDLGQQMMQQTDGTSMWQYMSGRFDGTSNEQTRALMKRQLYAQLESARCGQSGNIEGHLNYMLRLKLRLEATGMTLDDTVFSGMLVSSLPSNERFNRLRGLVETGMDCVSTPEKIVALAVTFDKANKTDQQLARSFGGNSGGGQAAAQGRHGKTPQSEGGGKKDSSKKNDANSEKKWQRDEDRKQRNCFGCHKPGHTKRDCPLAGSTQASAQATFTMASGFTGPAKQQGRGRERIGQTEMTKNTHGGLGATKD
ncbi:hypothetical protein BBJ28_00026124, partial [Nothophytophthora sp. Chile5]